MASDSALETSSPNHRPDEHVVLAPLVRLALDVRLVILLVGMVGLSVSNEPAVALALLALMALTSAGPVLLWRVIGAWVLHHPVAVLVDLLVGLAVLLAGGTMVLGVGYVVTTATLLGILYGVRGGLVLATPLVLATLRLVIDGDISEAAAAAVLIVVGTLVGAQLRRLVLDLEGARSEARLRGREAATAAERERLAREMHDSVAKTVHGIELSAVALRRIADGSPTTVEVADQIRDASRRASRETRALLHGLRIDDVSLPLQASLAQIVDTFGRMNAVEVTSDLRLGDADPDPDTRYEVVQVLREALRNVAQHARATAVSVSCAWHDERIELCVSDDGVGLGGSDDGAAGGHYGLTGMRERATALGGSLHVDGPAGRGTTVALSVPTVRQPT